MSPQQHSGVRVATKTDVHDYLHRHSDPFGSESEDVQRGIATVTPGTASYRGGSRTGPITTGTATYGREPGNESCHHRQSSLEGREPMQKSARPDGPTGATAMMKDDDQR